MTRVLTKEEIIQLAEEYAELGRWMTVRDWALKYYGEGAVRVEVEIEYKFNDGDPEYPSVQDATVYDAGGEVLEGNFGIGGDVLDYAEEMEYEAYEDLPATEDGHTYDLTRQPPISFPVVEVR
jgi:hypothetical protein